MKSAVFHPYLRLALLFAAVCTMLSVSAPARAEAPVRGDGDGGMPIVVVVSGTPEETPTPTPGGGNGGNGGNGNNGGGDDLAKTGLNILLIAGIGVGLVALGAAVLVAARRRSASRAS
ncbi:hypothetical protein [Dactylosporangium sp. CS-033363]|uniref:hypothetical protein n=1 Tax=Dactylosporangium sp. CS-033363 TaxID=3239935 RepID=UPI003D9488FD